MSSSSSSGIGLCGALTVLFVALKLLGVIGWSWWWITAPIWLPIVLILSIIPVTMIMLVICEKIGKIKRKLKKEKK